MRNVTIQKKVVLRPLIMAQKVPLTMDLWITKNAKKEQDVKTAQYAKNECHGRIVEHVQTAQYYTC